MEWLGLMPVGVLVGYHGAGFLINLLERRNRNNEVSV